MAEKININKATVEELKNGSDELGDKLAQRVYNFIHEKGGIRDFNELDVVSNIGPNTIETLRESFVVE